MDAPEKVNETKRADHTRSARSQALEILADLRTTGETVTALIHRRQLPPSERALATELTLGVVRHRLTLSRLLGVIATRGWKRISRPLQDILMLAGYQLIWLDGIPAFAAVDEAVRQAKRWGGQKAARFANAILRQLQRDIEHRRWPIEKIDPTRAIPVDANTYCQFQRVILPNPSLHPVEHLAISTSHPAWLVSRWAASFGLDRAKQICQTSLYRPPVILRPNRLRTDATGLANRLREEGLESVLDARAELVAIQPAGNLTQTIAFADGLFQTQDRTARAVVLEMSPQPGQTIVELCAGSGTKTTQMAELMDNRGTILASDINETRLAALRDNCTRLGLTIVRTVPACDLEAAVRTVGDIDWILVDAPCSNTGVLARRPEARYRVSTENLASLAELQFELLTNAARLATTHTRLAYSTCSLEPEENEQVAMRFSQSHPSWTLQANQITLPSTGSTPDHWQDGGYWTIWDQA